MFNSLKSRIIISITGIVFISMAITAFFIEQKSKQVLSAAIEENAVNLLEATMNHVESQYNSILYYKSVMLSRRKIELKNNTTIAFSIINSAYQKFKNGQISENTAKADAITDLRQLRYDNGIGYFWINDTTLPYPRMVMHPTIPELDGNILDDPEFNCALGREENLFIAFVDVCLEKGEGYVDYLWPKPMPGGLTERQPKISYVKLFKPWNWIIGTGVYIDDIEKDVQNQIDAVITNLNKTIIRQKIGESGYFFIFNEENYILVHPNLAGTDADHLLNPVTGNKLFNELKEAAFSHDHSMEYLWDKPGFEGEYQFPKKAYITYFEPLGWYIGSSVYKEDFEQKITNLTNTIILFSIFFLVIALIISLLISRSITKPLNNYVRSIRKTDKDGIPIDSIPKTEITEIQVLGVTMNNMINSIKETRKELKDQQEELSNLRNFLSNIIDSMPSILIGVDSDRKVTLWNKVAEQNTGITISEARGKILSDVFPQMASEMNRITESIRTREIKKDTKKVRETNDSTLYEDVTIYPLIANGVEGAVIRIDNVTDKVRMEKMMIQSEKMLSVGGLAAGMAHEINNPLAGMMQTASVMKNRLTNIEMPANKRVASEIDVDIADIKSFMEKRGIPNMIDAINESGKRVAAIVDNMLSFARKSEDQKSSHNVIELLDKTIELASTDYDMKKQYDFKQIAIQKEYTDNLPMIPCEGSKIQQVLLNILRNGAQAMHLAGTEKPQFIIRTMFEEDKGIVTIEIKDNGPGMDEETRKRVFDPFFTTKPVGVGTGLGLSVAYFIVTENNGGRMSVESELGKGAKFIISLPMEAANT